MDFVMNTQLLREDFKKKVKRVTSSLKVGRYETKNNILFEKKIVARRVGKKNKQTLFGNLWFS